MADHTATPSSAHPMPHFEGKKVLFVTPVAPWKLFGGTPIASRNLIALFSETTGAQVCCLRSDESGDYPQQTNGAAVLTGPVSGLSRKLKFFFDFSAESFAHRQFQQATVRARLAAQLAEQRPDFVIFDHIYSSWLIDLVQDPKVQVVYLAHDDMVAYADSLLELGPSTLKRLRFSGLRRQYQALQTKVLSRANFTLTMTPEDADRLRPSTRGSAEVAPIFFEFPDFAREYASEFTYLLITGSFDTWEKKLGLTKFIAEIFPAILAAQPGLRLVIAGRISAELRHQIPFSEPQLRIVQAPSDAEMREVVRQASAAVVLDLQASGLKIKTMELAAAGLPLVSWAPGVEGTGLIHEESCLRARTSAEFAAQLTRLYTEPELRKQLGAAAQSVIRSGFSKEAARARFKKTQLYSALADANALRPTS